MNLLQKIKGYYNNILNILDKMSNIQKLYVSIIFLIFMIIVTLGMKYLFKDNEDSINYKNISGDSLYTFSTSLLDKDTYIQIKSIADDVFYVCSSSKVDKEGKEITLKMLYDNCLYNDYKRSVSQKKFINNFEKLYNDMLSLNNGEGVFIPDNITIYKENFYLIRYTFEKDGNIVNKYLGIALDSNAAKYYIWYAE